MPALLVQPTWTCKFSLPLYQFHAALSSDVSIWNRISTMFASETRSLHKPDLVAFEAELQAKREALAEEDRGPDEDTDYNAIMRELGKEAALAEGAEAEYAEAMREMWEGGLGDYGGPDAGLAGIGDGGVMFDGNGIPAMEQYKFGKHCSQ